MEDLGNLLVSLATATGLAGLIGLEREFRLQNKLLVESPLGGVRTFAMMGALGFLATFLSTEYRLTWLLPTLFVMAMLFPLITHAYFVFTRKLFSVITALALIVSFCIGILIAFDELYFALALSILFTGILALRDALHKVARKLSVDELFAILQFIILSAIILPILPKSWIDPFGFFDWRPQAVWLMVVLVAAIRFVGYFLAKVFGGEKGILVSGLIGGFVSSTAVTMGISQESKGKSGVIIFLAPILVASGIMFFRVLFEVIIVTQGRHGLLAEVVLPLGVVGVVSLVLAGVLLLYRKKQHKKIRTSSLEIDQPLQLHAALSFGLFFLFILLISEKIGEYFSASGLYITGAIAGLTDVDAITLAMANLVSLGDLQADVAARVILLAVAVNTLVKLSIVFVFGSVLLFRKLTLSLVGIFALGLVMYLVTLVG